MKKVIMLIALLQSGFVMADQQQLILDCKVAETSKGNSKLMTSFELFGTFKQVDNSSNVNIIDVASIVGIFHHSETKLLFVGGKGGSSSGPNGNMSVDLIINGKEVTLKAKGEVGTLDFEDEKIELSKCNNVIDFEAVK